MDDTNWAPVPADAVLSSAGAENIPFNQDTVKGEAFQKIAEQRLINRMGREAERCLNWFGCKMLKPGGEWQRVKVRVKITVEIEYTDR
jgi:hypothetical protein